MSLIPTIPRMNYILLLLLLTPLLGMPTEANDTSLTCRGVCSWNNATSFSPPDTPTPATHVSVSLSSHSTLSLLVPPPAAAAAASLSVSSSFPPETASNSFALHVTSPSSLTLAQGPRLEATSVTLQGDLRAPSLSITASTATLGALDAPSMDVSIAAQDESDDGVDAHVNLPSTLRSLTVVGGYTPAIEGGSLFLDASLVCGSLSVWDLHIEHGVSVEGLVNVTAQSIHLKGGLVTVPKNTAAVISPQNPLSDMGFTVSHNGGIQIPQGSSLTSAGLDLSFSHGSLQGPGVLRLQAAFSDPVFDPTDTATTYDALSALLCSSSAAVYTDAPAIEIGQDPESSPDYLQVPLSPSKCAARDMVAPGSIASLTLGNALFTADAMFAAPIIPTNVSTLILSPKSVLIVSDLYCTSDPVQTETTILYAPSIQGMFGRAVFDDSRNAAFELAQAVEHVPLSSGGGMVLKVVCVARPEPPEPPVWSASTLTSKEKRNALIASSVVGFVTLVGASVWIYSFGPSAETKEWLLSIKTALISNFGSYSILSRMLLLCLYIFLLPFVCEGIVMMLLSFACIPLAFILHGLEHKALPVFFIVVLFVHVGGLADLVADIILLAKVIWITNKDLYSSDDSSSSSSSSGGGEEEMSESDERKEELEQMFLLLRFILTVLGALPALASYQLYRFIKVEERELANKKAGRDKDEGKDDDPAQLQCSTLPLLFMAIATWKLGLVALRLVLLWKLVKSLATHGFRHLSHATHAFMEIAETILGLDLVWSGLPLGVLTLTELYAFSKLSHIDNQGLFEILKLSAVAIDGIGFCALVYLNHFHGRAHDGHDHGGHDHGGHGSDHHAKPTERTGLINSHA